MKLQRSTTLLLAITALSVAAATAVAESYTFINIADATGPWRSFNAPTLNNDGTAAFFAEYDSGVSAGIFTGSGGAVTAIANTGEGFIGMGPPVINNAGTVAFYATLPAGQSGIFTNIGGTIETIADTIDDPYQNFDISPTINNNGVVAFVAGPDGGGSGVFTGNGGDITTIADTSGAFMILFAPAISDSGTVAFFASLSAGGSGLYAGSGGGTMPIASDTGMFAGFGPPSINSSGTVAFAAVLHDDSNGIYTIGGSSSFPTIIANNASAFAYFGDPWINNDGDIAFRGNLNDGRVGIFTGGDPVADKVVVVGDALFGSTVADLEFSRGLNGHGDIAFRYTLADGRTGIAVAVAPGMNTLAGDFDEDGDVDGRDFLLWQRNPSVGDLADWQAGYGMGTLAGVGDAPARSVAVPEPSSMILVLLSGLALAYRGARTIICSLLPCATAANK